MHSSRPELRVASRTSLFVGWLTAFAVLPLAVAQDHRSVLDNAVSTAKIHGFTEILRNSGIPIERLRNEEITLLIPVDVSFYDLTPEQYWSLLSPDDRVLAVRYIESHMIEGRYSLPELEAGKYRTVNGTEIAVTKTAESDQPHAINGRPIVHAGIIGSNGYAYLIRGFLLEP